MQVPRPLLISGISNTTHATYLFHCTRPHWRIAVCGAFPAQERHTRHTFGGVFFDSCKGGPVSMAQGTLANLSSSAFVRTPPLFAEWIVHSLLTFPAGEVVTILDPTAGEGDLLAPCQAFPAARLYGVAISADRADTARQRLSHATMLTSAFEGTTCAPGSMSLVLANPPYFFSNGRRAEYRIIAAAGELLMPGGIMVAIIPARSAWDGTMIAHWCKWYDQVRVWKFPDRTDEDEEGGFEDYTQICVLGVHLATPRVPDTAQKRRLSGFRWRKPEKVGQSPW